MSTQVEYHEDPKFNESMASTHSEKSFVSEMYKHQPLDTSKHQIRLLRIDTSSGKPMHYRLEIFDYESVPRYAALSYTWGNDASKNAIFIDGKPFQILPNLFAFLEHYQSSAYIWIDQICINQSNHQERNHQVSLMCKIYEGCKLMLVWLRDDATFTPSTNQAATDFMKGVDAYWNQDTCEIKAKDGRVSLRWPALSLLRNPYFDRLWIVQELLLAKSILILVEGNVWIPWCPLREKHTSLWGEVRSLIPSTIWLLEAYPTRFLFAGHTSKSLSWNITLTAGRYFNKICKDPRDKVYGFMALVAPSHKIAVDYQKSVQCVFLDAIMAMIRDFWFMKRDIPEYGRDLFRIKGDLDSSIDSSHGLAQAMISTDLEKYGLKSFVEGVWERVRQYESTARYLEPGAVDEIDCITSVGFEPGNHQSSGDVPRTTSCARWWYEFEGTRYYHDCKEWSGDWTLQEYTESAEDGS
ncbi:HET-domain-containing protein [Aaosphaeria arxii CBS 175.79]|uniref:HET-domain-containing protein n=1 Tax=Aaosphaeria arxii CBS 175.79 TaxID=1450172 RepID=A0A6A5X779_9PLEO|nr:HET-domain-containing protein [Aaosphaeria arxii CBS 175.79]KAF2008771.1 HET-domain-containing protein [Aaosphaeria arxii CBS 175.79]